MGRFFDFVRRNVVLQRKVTLVTGLALVPFFKKYSAYGKLISADMNAVVKLTSKVQQFTMSSNT